MLNLKTVVDEHMKDLIREADQHHLAMRARPIQKQASIFRPALDFVGQKFTAWVQAMKPEASVNQTLTPCEEC